MLNKVQLLMWVLVLLLWSPLCIANAGEAHLGLHLGYEFITAAYFDQDGPRLAARVKGSSDYLSIMQKVQAGENDIDTRLHEMGENTAVAILADMLDETKRASIRKAGKHLRIGVTAVPIDGEQSFMGIVIEAMHKIEDYLTEHARVISSRGASPMTFTDNFCHRMVRPNGYYRHIQDELVVAVEHTAGRYHVSIAEMERQGPLIDLTSRRVVTDAGLPLVDAIKDIVEAEEYPIRGAVVAGDLTTNQLNEVLRSMNSAVPRLADKVRIPLGSPEFVSAVGAACHAWDLANYPEAHMSHSGLGNVEL